MFRVQGNSILLWCSLATLPLPPLLAIVRRASLVSNFVYGVYIFFWHLDWRVADTEGGWRRFIGNQITFATMRKYSMADCANSARHSLELHKIHKIHKTQQDFLFAFHKWIDTCFINRELISNYKLPRSNSTTTNSLDPKRLHITSIFIAFSSPAHRFHLNQKISQRNRSSRMYKYVSLPILRIVSTAHWNVNDFKIFHIFISMNWRIANSFWWRHSTFSYNLTIITTNLCVLQTEYVAKIKCSVCEYDFDQKLAINVKPNLLSVFFLLFLQSQIYIVCMEKVYQKLLYPHKRT